MATSLAPSGMMNEMMSEFDMSASKESNFSVVSSLTGVVLVLLCWVDSFSIIFIPAKSAMFCAFSGLMVVMKNSAQKTMAMYLDLCWIFSFSRMAMMI